jgi:hypothetical protein
MYTGEKSTWLSPDNTNGDTRLLYGTLLDWGASRGLREKVEKDIRGTENEVA